MKQKIQKEFLEHINSIRELVAQEKLTTEDLIFLAAVYKYKSIRNLGLANTFKECFEETCGALDDLSCATEKVAIELPQMADDWLKLVCDVNCEAQKIGFENGKKDAPRRNANKRHAENHQLKNDVFSWLDKNMHNYKSMDSAAEAIAGKIVPMKFRTVRNWVGQWKKLRSASKL
jgi:hypothetical protein